MNGINPFDDFATVFGLVGMAVVALVFTAVVAVDALRRHADEDEHGRDREADGDIDRVRVRDR